jgi:hypothetical protein
VFFSALISRIEEVRCLERWCRHLRLHGCYSPAPPNLLTHAEDIHLLTFLSLTIANFLSAFYIYLHFDALVAGGSLSKGCFVLGIGTIEVVPVV